MGNVIAFSLIGKAGPVTFQVVGHVKTMLIFIFGLLLFPEKEESHSQFVKKITGLVVSMVGVILYTVFEIRAKEQEKKLPEGHVPLR
jgi:solute carrier family 35 protein E3